MLNKINVSEKVSAIKCVLSNEKFKSLLGKILKVDHFFRTAQPYLSSIAIVTALIKSGKRQNVNINIR